MSHCDHPHTQQWKMVQRRWAPEVQGKVQGVTIAVAKKTQHKGDLSQPKQNRGSVCVAESSIEYKNGATNKMNFEERKSLEYAQPSFFFP